jgi:negative regulator of flagellin synthesis FlgM
MKIDNSLKSAGTPGGENRTGNSARTDARKAPESGVSVALSGQASQLQALEVRIASADVVNTARVSEIKQAIAEGRFQVNPDVVADRLLQTVQDLLRSYKPQ